MRLATAAESKRIDELAQSRYGIAGESLMEAAGAGAAREIEQSFIPELRRESRRTVAVVCGPGNNGADGLVVARHLRSGGHHVRVLLVAPVAKRTELFKIQFDRCQRALLAMEDFSPAAPAQLAQAGVVVDAIFGIGFRGPLAEPYRGAIEAINGCREIPVVSLDAPSGLDVDRGLVGDGGAAVKAMLTVTFGLFKPGFFLNEGPMYVGRLRRLAIGYPQELLAREADSCFAFTEAMVLRRLPRWPATAHKSSHGHALLLAGSPGMYGAGILAASSAFRIGSGYATLASHEDPVSILGDMPEVMTARALDERLWSDRKWTAAGIGSGLGTGQPTLELLRRLAKMPDAKVVADADAITVAAREKLFPLPSQWIMTPHAGELARVINVPAKQIESDRLRYAREGATKTGCHILLKGFRTVLCEPESGRATIVLSGNSALSKAGTGDVLTGMITGLLAQGLEPAAAALTGAYIHGRMADEWVRSENSKRSLQASDLRDILPGLMARLSTSLRKSR